MTHNVEGWEDINWIYLAEVMYRYVHVWVLVNESSVSMKFGKFLG